jgi:S1-C subfamily serine protease
MKIRNWWALRLMILSQLIGFEAASGGGGTGFFVSDQGHVITNHHVVEGADKIVIFTEDGKVEAEVLAASEKWDIAILKAPLENTPFVKIGDSSSVNLGDEVFTIGFPMVQNQGFSPKYSKGNIASENGWRDDPDQFQTSVAVQPGNSGGGLFNTNGEVIGIVTGSMNKIRSLVEEGFIPENVNYAVKSIRAEPFLSFIEAEVPALDPEIETPVQRATSASVFISATTNESSYDTSTSTRSKSEGDDILEVVYRGRDGVSLRVAPDASSPKVGSIYAGARVLETGKRSEPWIQVVVMGWMAIHGSVTRFLVEESPRTWVVQKNQDGLLAMRNAPGSESAKIADFLPGVSLGGEDMQEIDGQTWISVRRVAWVAERGASGAAFLR